MDSPSTSRNLLKTPRTRRLRKRKEETDSAAIDWILYRNKSANFDDPPFNWPNLPAEEPTPPLRVFPADSPIFERREKEKQSKVMAEEDRTLIEKAQALGNAMIEWDREREAEQSAKKSKKANEEEEAKKENVEQIVLDPPDALQKIRNRLRTPSKLRGKTMPYPSSPTSRPHSRRKRPNSALDGTVFRQMAKGDLVDEWKDFEVNRKRLHLELPAENKVDAQEAPSTEKVQPQEEPSKSAVSLPATDSKNVALATSTPRTTCSRLSRVPHFDVSPIVPGEPPVFTPPRPPEGSTPKSAPNQGYFIIPEDSFDLE